MKKSYNVFSKLPFIKLSDKEVKVIEEAIKICDKGDKFAWEVCEGEEFENQRSDFAWAKIYLNNILVDGNLDYYQKKIKYLDNFEKWNKATHEAWKRKGNLPVFDLKNGRII